MAFLQPKDETAASSTDTQSSTKLVERDVEAPDVFEVSEAGLWDGRPSLGGVWVAHPDVTDPERVIIRNSANGKFVIGALFRREREIPGPRIQASSDAASALGMLAGAPVELHVTALRRETAEEKPATEEQTAALSEADAIADSALDPIAGAAAAIAATEPAATASTDTAASDTAVSVAAVADTAGAGTETADAAEAKPKRRKLFGGLFGTKAVAESEAVAGTGTEAETATETMAEPIQVATIDPVAPPAAAPVAVAAAAPKPKSSSLDKAYIQIGIFSVEANADRTADLMRSEGMIPTVRAQKSSGKAYWRVVVGPAQTKSERSALLGKVKEAGFSDAYAVTN